MFKFKTDSPDLNESQSQLVNVTKFYTSFGICRGSPYYLFFKSVDFKAEQFINNSNVNNVRNVFNDPKLFDFF